MNGYEEALELLKNREFHKALPKYLDLMARCDSTLVHKLYFEVATIFLTQKRFLEGFSCYEHRRFFSSHTIIKYGLEDNLYQGQVLEDERVLLVHEQGFGDTIHFIRFVPQFQKAHPSTKITLFVQQSLHSLLKYSYPNIEFVDSISGVEYDYALPLLSIPFRLKIKDIKPKRAYLKAPTKKLVEKEQSLRVGICWQGNSASSVDSIRSIDHNQILSLLPSQATIYSLQKDIKLNSSRVVEKLEPNFSFLDSAKVVANLDFVISVDTSVAHLSSALGVPTFILLPYESDWRWGESDTRSYWYHNTFLFRQDSSRSWSKPLFELKQALLNRVYSNEHIDLESALEMQKASNYEMSNYYFKSYIKKNRDFIEAYLGVANNYISQNLEKKAKKTLKKAIKQSSTKAKSLSEALYNLALIYKKEQKLAKAKKFYKKALELNPENFNALVNLADIYHAKQKYKASISCYSKALLLKPNNLEVLNSKASLLYEVGKFKKSQKIYDQILSQSDDPKYHLHYSFLLFRVGDLKSAFREYEYRKDIEKVNSLIKPFSDKFWSGEDISNRTLLVLGEQGFGDNIEFFRFVEILKDRYPDTKLYYRTRKELVKLLSSKALDGVYAIEDSIDIEYDYCVPIMSIPYILGITKKKELKAKSYPYIEISKNILQKNKPSTISKNLKVGLCWYGNSMSKELSFSLSDLEPILNIKDMEFYSLQLGANSEELDRYGIVDLVEDSKDFYDTAKAISALDVVVTADSAVAHLCGALDIQAHVLLPFSKGVMWMNEEGKSSWYNSVYLYKPDIKTKWQEPISHIAKLIKKY
jgi:ADP-heptose:LPS heptosyltransferase/Tfp pilus assembly protein PilF